jgi:NIPSNAP
VPRGYRVIVEERTYHVYTGKLAEVVRLYAEEGTEVQQRHLGNLVGAFTVDIGDLSSIVQLWGYDSLDERQRRRAALQADDAWKDILKRLQPLIHTQRNRILVPTSFSPIR